MANYYPHRTIAAAPHGTTTATAARSHDLHLHEPSGCCPAEPQEFFREKPRSVEWLDDDLWDLLKEKLDPLVPKLNQGRFTACLVFAAALFVTIVAMICTMFSTDNDQMAEQKGWGRWTIGLAIAALVILLLYAMVASKLDTNNHIVDVEIHAAVAGLETEFARRGFGISYTKQRIRTDSEVSEKRYLTLSQTLMFPAAIAPTSASGVVVGGIEAAIAAAANGSPIQAPAAHWDHQRHPPRLNVTLTKPYRNAPAGIGLVFDPELGPVVTYVSRPGPCAHAADLEAGMKLVTLNGIISTEHLTAAQVLNGIKLSYPQLKLGFEELELDTKAPEAVWDHQRHPSRLCLTVHKPYTCAPAGISYKMVPGIGPVVTRVRKDGPCDSEHLRAGLRLVTINDTPTAYILHADTITDKIKHSNPTVRLGFEEPPDVPTVSEGWKTVERIAAHLSGETSSVVVDPAAVDTKNEKPATKEKSAKKEKRSKKKGGKRRKDGVEGAIVGQEHAPDDTVESESC